MKRFVAILGIFFRMKAEEAWEFTIDTALPTVATLLLAALIIFGSCYLIGWGLLGWDGFVKEVYTPSDGSKTIEQAREDLIKDGVIGPRIASGMLAMMMFVMASVIVYIIVYSVYRVVKFLVGNWKDAVAEVDFDKRMERNKPGRG